MTHTLAHAKDIGIANDNDWPYGPNIDQKARVALVTWARAHRLRYAHRARCLHWIFTGRCAVQICSLDWGSYKSMDHITGWTRDGKPAVLVAQPYGLLTRDIISLAEVAAAHDLDVRINGTGWYGHGTTFIQLWRPSI